MVVDSGSSDPWLVTNNFQCYSFAEQQLDTEDKCYFGTPYNPNSSSTYSTLNGENFNISYADGETLTGTMGVETFQLAGITVPHQEFAMVNYAAWSGDGVSSGLVGFAYSSLTSAYPGTNPSNDQPGTTIIYPTLFTDMFTNQGVPPVFSLVLSRDQSAGGVLALGGLPGVPHGPTFISTPVNAVGINASTQQAVYEYYTINVDGFALSANRNAQFNTNPNITNPNKLPIYNATTAIVDSGTSLFYAPDYVANLHASQFIPPAVFDVNNNVWSVQCNAIPPVFGVVIKGKVFYVNPADMILQYSATECIAGIQPNNGGLVILGDVWMKSVVSVFDIGAQMMRFAAREYYNLTALTPIAAST
jgi:hypothetical protein